MQDRIEKASGIRLNDFPESDYRKIEEALETNDKVEVWLVKGMGRYYITPIVGENTLCFPIQRKLCELSNV